MFRKILFSTILLQIATSELIPYYTDQEAKDHMQEYASYHYNFTKIRTVFFMNLRSLEINVEKVLLDSSSTDQPFPNYMNSLYGYAYHPYIGELFSKIKTKLITEAGYNINNLSLNQKNLIDFRWEKIQDYLENAIKAHASRNGEENCIEPCNITMDFLLEILQTFEKRESYKELPLHYYPSWQILIPRASKNREELIEEAIGKLIAQNNSYYRRMLEEDNKLNL